MKSLAVWVLPPYQRDELFEQRSSMNRDDCLAPFHALKRGLEARSWTCHTQDYFLSRGEKPTDVLFIDMPSAAPSALLGDWYPAARSHLLIQECEVVLPRNWEFALHENYSTISTWHPDLIAKNGRYREANFSQRLHSPGPGLAFDSRKFCTLIAGNKGSSHPLELYSKRVEAIRWFERHDPASFDLYGMGWDKLEHSGVVNKVLNRFPRLARVFASKFPSYRGKVASKKATLETYKFAICFENAQKIPGYVTEKIFDCLLAGCVPVYWGAPDIADRIPPECYINYRNFGSMEAVVAHMRSWKSQDFETFLSATNEFLASSKAQRYSVDFFARSLAEGLSSR